MPFYRLYGTATNIESIPLMTAGSSVIKANPTLATTDVKVSQDGGAWTIIETSAVGGSGTFSDHVAVTPASGQGVRVHLHPGHLQCKVLAIKFQDASGAEWSDRMVEVETYGSGSAAHQFNFNTPYVTVGSINANAITGTAVAAGAATKIHTAVKVKTDLLTFSGTAVKSYVSSINANAVTGTAIAAGAVTKIQTAIKAKTDLLTYSGTAVKSYVSAIDANVITGTAVAAGAVTKINTAVKTKTDKLTFTGTAVHAKVTAMANDTITANAVAANAFTSDAFAAGAITPTAAPNIGTDTTDVYDAVSALQGDTTAIKAKTDLLAFSGTAAKAYVSSINAGAITANAINAGAITSAKFASDAITGTVLGAGAVSEIQAGMTGTITSIYSLVSSGNITVAKPVSDGGSVSLIQGDAYEMDDTAHTVQWTSTSWPNMAGANSGTTSVTVRGTDYDVTKTTVGAGSQTLTLTLTAAETSAIPAGTWPYSLWTTIAGSPRRHVTLVSGNLTVEV